MDAATDTAGAISKARGRKDANGQQAVFKTNPLKLTLDDGVRLKIVADEAGEKYGDWVKAKAEECGMLAAVVRKIVNAKAADKWEEESRKAEQLNLAFDEIGDV
ncbi:MAG: hypothetical protein IH604_16215 [Burkholderiales bacterium]|nr:hypothetical protein [Burkholderiales bacterium]